MFPYTVGAKNVRPYIELLFVILCNITSLHHNTNIISIDIKQFMQVTT